MSIIVNLYYKGHDGSARRFAQEMESRGIADAIRKEDGNERYEYFQPINDPETVLLIDCWRALRSEATRSHLTDIRPSISDSRSGGVKSRASWTPLWKATILTV